VSSYLLQLLEAALMRAIYKLSEAKRTLWKKNLFGIYYITNSNIVDSKVNTVSYHKPKFQKYCMIGICLEMLTFK